MRSFLIDRLIENGQVNSSVVPLTNLSTNSELDGSVPTAKVINTELTISATGALILVVGLEPLKVNGIKITHIYEYARYCSTVQPGDLVTIEFSKSQLDCYCSGSTSYFRTPYSATCKTSSDEHLNAPENCPTCHSPLAVVDGLMRCSSIYCPSTLPSRIVHWPAWKHFNVEKPDYQLAEQLIQTFRMCSSLDLYSLSFHGLVKECGLTTERARLMMMALEYFKQQPWPHMMMGLGIRHLRLSDLNKISTAYPSLEALKATDLEALQQIGLGHAAAAQSLAAWLSTPKNQEFLSEAKLLFKTSIFTPASNDHQPKVIQSKPQKDSTDFNRIGVSLERSLKGIKGDVYEVNSNLQDIDYKYEERQQALLEVISELPRSHYIHGLGDVIKDLSKLETSIQETAIQIEEGQEALRQEIQTLPSHYAIQRLSRSIEEREKNTLERIEKQYKSFRVRLHGETLEQLTSFLDKTLQEKFFEELTKKLSGLIEQIKQREAKDFQKLEARILEQDEQLASLKESLEREEKAKATLDSESSQLYAQLAAEEATCNSLSEDLRKAKEHLEESRKAQELIQSEKLQLLHDSEAQLRDLRSQHQQALGKAQADRQELTADLDTYQRLVTEREQQLQLLREALATSLTKIAERLDNPETGDTHNSPESLSSDSFADLRQSLLTIDNSLQAIPSISTALVVQIRHAEEQLTLQNQHLQDLTQTRDALQAERDSARAELATSQETLSAQVAEKSQLTGKLQALEAQYAELEREHHQSILEKGKLQERMAYLERSEQAQRKAQQQCQDKLRETQQQLEEEREKPKLFGLFNRSKANTPQDS